MPFAMMYGTYMQYIYICIDKCAPVQIHVLAQKYMLPLDLSLGKVFPRAPLGRSSLSQIQDLQRNIARISITIFLSIATAT